MDSRRTLWIRRRLRETRLGDTGFRALRADGSLEVVHVIRTGPSPRRHASRPGSVTACIAGAATADATGLMIVETSFEAVAVTFNEDSDEFISGFDENHDLSEYLVSAWTPAVNQRPGRSEATWRLQVCRHVVWWHPK